MEQTHWTNWWPHYYYSILCCKPNWVSPHNGWTPLYHWETFKIINDLDFFCRLSPDLDCIRLENTSFQEYRPQELVLRVPHHGILLCKHLQVLIHYQQTLLWDQLLSVLANHQLLFIQLEDWVNLCIYHHSLIISLLSHINNHKSFVILQVQV